MDKISKSKVFIGMWIGILISIVLSIVFANVLINMDPNVVDLSNVLSPPSRFNILGTDNMGRDVLARILYGGRISLGISAIAGISATLIGTAYGAISGYFGGVVNEILMRILDGLLVIPTIVVMLTANAIIGGGVVTMILLIALTGWMPAAKIVALEFAEAKQKDYIKAAYVVGSSHAKIIFHHMLRNSLSSIFVVMIFSCSNAIFTEVTLDYLGVGVPPHIASWGNMLSNAQNYVLIGGWWMVVPPGLVILLSMLSINFLAEEIKERYNTKGEEA